MGDLRDYKEANAVDAAVADIERFQAGEREALPVVSYLESQAEFAGEVWNKMSAIDVNAHTEQKGGFTYLSWNWAWNTLMHSYPASSYTFSPDTVTDEGVMVFCELTVANGKNSLKREMWLPVLDFKNKPISKPNPMDVNTARMRCLVKTMAMVGLGNYIYSGQAAPVVHEDPNLEDFSAAVKASDSETLFNLHYNLDQEEFGSLVATIKSDPKSKDNPRGNKTKKHDAIWEMIDDVKNSLIEHALIIRGAVEDDDRGLVDDLSKEIADCSKESKQFVWDQLSYFEQQFMKSNTTEETVK